MSRLFLILSLGLFLYADVMYEMTTTSKGMMGMGGESTVRVYVKGDRSRTETTSEGMMGGEVTNITITRLDKNVIWTLDNENKQYAEIEIGEFMKVEEEETEETVPEIKIEKTGKTKEILGKTCEEVIVSMDIKSDEGSMTMTQTMWVTTDITGYEELKEFNKKFGGNGSGQSMASMTKDKKSYNEFQEKISEVEGFPLELEMEFSMGAEIMPFSMRTHSTVTKIDTKPISDKVFEIPEGYSLEE
jgi:hypothetical protein